MVGVAVTNSSREVSPAAVGGLATTAVTFVVPSSTACCGGIGRGAGAEEEAAAAVTPFSPPLSDDDGASDYEGDASSVPRGCGAAVVGVGAPPVPPMPASNPATAVDCSA